MEGSRFKAIGVVKGVSDMIFVGKGKVLFLEMKTGVGVQSNEQIEFQAKVKSRGHRYFVVRSFEEFKLTMKTMLL
jgi:hypothetical protein